MANKVKTAIVSIPLERVWFVTPDSNKILKISLVSLNPLGTGLVCNILKEENKEEKSDSLNPLGTGLVCNYQKINLKGLQTLHVSIPLERVWFVTLKRD